MAEKLQSSVGIFPALGVEGDFASTNPRATAPNNNGKYLSNGTPIIGQFCWTGEDGLLASSGTGAPLGFVARDGNFSLISDFDGYTLTISKGMETTVHIAGDFYVRPQFDVLVGDIVQASLTDGSVKPLTPTEGALPAAEDGYALTKFTFKTAASAGELAIISTY